MRLTIIPGGTYVLDPLIHICNKLPNLKLELKDERLSQDISFLLHAGTESPKWWKYYNKHVNRAELRLSYRPIKYCHIPYETLFQGVLTTYIPPEPWEYPVYHYIQLSVRAQHFKALAKECSKPRSITIDGFAHAKSIEMRPEWLDRHGLSGLHGVVQVDDRIDEYDKT
jgi:hypothetical protein